MKDKFDLEKEAEVNQLREDLFVTCVEGGSNYWALFEYISKDAEAQLSGMAWSVFLWKYVRTGGKVAVYDAEETDDILGYVTMENVFRGERTMRQRYPSHYNNMINENWDSETADVWLQCIVMNNIVFG